MKIGVKKMRDTAQVPAYHSDGAAGFDIAAAETIIIPPHTLELIPTGLVFEVPPGYCLGIFARSSTPRKYRVFVANGVGVLDSDYRGQTDECKILVYNYTDEYRTIAQGDRIAQGIILAAPQVELVPFEPAPASRGGFGSTDE